MPRSIPRRTFTVALVAALAGCTEGDDGGGAGPSPTLPEPETTEPNGSPTLPEPQTTEPGESSALQLTSSAFEDGGQIPEKYGYEEANVNPPLSISGVPSDAASLTLIMDDPDAVEPAGKVWLHWLVWNIPPSTTDIPEGWDPEEAVVGQTDFDSRGYGGPAPPDETHTYRFRLWALDTTLDLPDTASKDEVLDAMDGHTLAMSTLRGTYSP